MAQQQMAKTEESLGGLFSELAAQTGTLVRQEVSLAQVELTRKAALAGKQVGFLAIGGAVSYAGLLVILTGVVIILANFIPLSASALIVGALAGGGGLFIFSTALAELKKTNWAPRESVESIKEDAQWIKNQIN